LNSVSFSNVISYNLKSSINPEHPYLIKYNDNERYYMIIIDNEFISTLYKWLIS